MTRHRWRGAVIGCGFFAPNHLNAWREIADADIVAVCDLDVSRARAASEAFGVSAFYPDPATLLSRESLDFIDIVAGVASHRSLVELAAPAVKLVICQKPFAETLVDADAMIQACGTCRTQFLIHENFRWQHPFLEIARRLEHGEIGCPKRCRLTFHHDYAEKYRNQPYLATTNRLALMDVGVHLFDVARLLMGEVRSLHCRTQRLNPQVQGEDAFLISCRHESGAVTVIDCSFAALGQADLFPQTLVDVAGSRGRLGLLPGYRLIEQYVGDGGQVTEQHVAVEPPVPTWGAKPWHVIQDSVINFQRHAIDVLEGRAEPHPSGLDNRKTLALVLAAYESAAHDEVINF